MNENENSVPLSPVANCSYKNQPFAKLILMIIAVIVVGLFIFHKLYSTSSTDSITNAEQSNLPTVVAAPQLTEIQEEMQQLKSAIETETRSIAVNKDQDENEKLKKMRMVASTTAYSASGNTSQATHSNKNNDNVNQGVLGGSGTSGDDNTQFISQLSSSRVLTSKANHLQHPAETLAQGTMIWATLESRINSDLPGMVRAVTSEDIFGDDGTIILIPRGSRLIGQYNSTIAQGQFRVFVVWQRVLRPDHIDIQINSPGTDPLGSAGMSANSVDKHFIEQFSNAALLSLIGAGTANIGVHTNDQFNSASAYREALSSSFNQTAQSTLKQTGVIKPTLTINQGNRMSVFVSRDLDFHDELLFTDKNNS